MKIYDNSKTLEEELKINGFLNYQEWSEINLQRKQNEDSRCYRCNKPLLPLTWIEPDFYYLPCWDCVRRKTEKALITENIIQEVKDFYNSRILGDRYLQLFLVDPIYFSNTLPHEYNVFKKVINSLSPPSRNDIWFLDWKPGYPKIINQDNLEGLKIVNLSTRYSEIVLGKTSVRVGDYEVLPPELTSVDTSHYHRSSILNRNGERRNKRLRMGDKCIRFYNTDNPEVKSIFRLTKGGEEVALRSLSYSDYATIKLAIMRDKTFLRIIFDILLEILRGSKIFRDGVFLKNTIMVDPQKNAQVNFIWNSISRDFIKNYVNICLI